MLLLLLLLLLYQLCYLLIYLQFILLFYFFLFIHDLFLVHDASAHHTLTLSLSSFILSSLQLLSLYKNLFLLEKKNHLSILQSQLITRISVIHDFLCFICSSWNTQNRLGRPGEVQEKQVRHLTREQSIPRFFVCHMFTIMCLYVVEL